MTNSERLLAREVHELLLLASPQKADANLTKAAEVASAASNTVPPGEDFRETTFLAIQNARIAISEGASAAEGEQFLLVAIRAVEQWVRHEP